jgi:hypothetical protein
MKRIGVVLVLLSVGALVGCSGYEDPPAPGDPTGGTTSQGGTSGAAQGGTSGAAQGGTSGGRGGMGALGGTNTTGGGAGMPATGGSAGAGGEATGGSAGDMTCAAGANAVTSICGSRTLGSLTQTEGLKLCSDTGAYVARTVTKANGCKYLAVVDAASLSSPDEEGMRSSCSAQESACNANPVSMGPGEDTICGDLPPTCTATVAEYSTCVMDETVLFEQGVGELIGCAMLTFANVSTVFDVSTNATMAASCQALATACPNFFPPSIY